MTIPLRPSRTGRSEALAAVARPSGGPRRAAVKVLVLGTGVIGVSAAYELAGAGHEVVVVDRQPGAGARDQLRQCRRGLARLLVALGRAGHPAQGDQVAVDAPPAAGHPAEPRLGDDPLGARDAAQLHRRALRDQQERAWCALAEYSRDSLRELRAATGIAYDERSAGHAAAVPHPEAARRHRQATSRSCADSGVAYELLDRDGCIRARAGAGARAGEVRRRPAPARRRDRRLLQVHQRLAALAAERGVEFRYGTTHPHARPRRRPDHRRRPPTSGTVEADAYVVALGSYSPLLLRPIGIDAPGLSGQGLLDHRADHRSGAARPNRR